MAFGTGTHLQINLPPEPESASEELGLLPAIEPWGSVFRRNLGDFLTFRDWPNPFDKRTYEGWRASYVFTDAPWTRIRESWWGHALLAVATFAICTSPFFFGKPVKMVSPFEHAHIQYYPTSDYLPAINNSAPRPKTTKRPDPVYAKQEIISVRPNADNHTQTIVTPPQVKLQHDVPLPNMAVWTNDPVAATVEAPKVQPKMIFPLAAQVVEPTPDISQVRDKRNVSLQSSAVEPTVSDRNLRRAGQMNMADLRPDVVAPAPKLPVPAQRASGLTVAEAVPPAPTINSKRAGGAGSTSVLHPDVVPPTANAASIARRGVPNGALAPQVVPPQPSVSTMANNSKGGGQIIALSVHPADVHGPVSIPAGNRNGEFAAGPTGKPDATGQPDASRDAKPAGNGAVSGAEKNNGPAGVFVAAPPPGAVTAPISGAGTTEMAKLQFPKMQHTTVADLAKATKPSPTAPEARNPLADKVFAGKRYYSLTLNMPNLNSATGSWVVRFAELNDRKDGIPVVAPVATNKLDPVYPQELLHDRVEGTVTLYAVIRPDGTVADIRVIKGLDKALDYSAMRALAGWRFVPGMKNGAAVALEAIVDIPFHLRPIAN